MTADLVSQPSTVGESRRLARVAAATRHAWPMWVFAVSLNGFFVYLAVFELLALGTSSATTAIYYAALCVALLAAAWTRRLIVAERLRGSGRLVGTWIGAGLVLATWFVLNTAIFSEGPLAPKLAALLLLWTIPTALVALSLRLDDLPTVAQGLLTLALAFMAVETAAIVAADDDVFRFTPISTLDPISAGLVPALGAVSALSLRPQTTGGRLVQFVVAAVLVAGSVVPGSRGPVLALLVSALAIAFVQPLPLRAMLPLSVVAGLAAGVAVSSHVGSLEYLTSTFSAARPVPSVATTASPTGCEGEEPIPVTEVFPPDRLIIDGHAISPGVSGRSPTRLTLGLHVSCRGKDVDGAAVHARVALGGDYRESPEVATDAYGWAWVTLRQAVPAGRTQPSVTVTARARRAGEDVFLGVTTARQLTVSIASYGQSGLRPHVAGR